MRITATFHAPHLVWGSVWRPLPAYTEGQPKYVVSFTPECLPDEMREYARTIPARTATEFRDAVPAYVAARSSISPVIVPDDINSLRFLLADADLCSVWPDQMLRGIEADLHVAGWEVRGRYGLALLGIRVKVADLRARFNHIIEFKGE